MLTDEDLSAMWVDFSDVYLSIGPTILAGCNKFPLGTWKYTRNSIVSSLFANVMKVFDVIILF